MAGVRELGTDSVIDAVLTPVGGGLAEDLVLAVSRLTSFFFAGCISSLSCNTEYTPLISSHILGIWGWSLGNLAF